ncbi:MAG: GNAT family N-acetyltransferase [Hyphomicrobiales bacterium]|nr:GNAT family N-acetyltransferase [Hyphomicrobiales bacterium]
MGNHSYLDQHSNDNYIGEYEGYDFSYYSDIESIETHWEYLQQNKLVSPFQKLSWAKGIIAGEHQFAELNAQQQTSYLFVVGFTEGTPALLLPFVVQNGLLGCRLKWLGEKISDYNSMVFDHEKHAAMSTEFFSKILEMIHEKFPSIHAAHLIRNPASILMKSEKTDMYSQRLTAEYSSHALTLQKDWKEQFARLRSSKSRQRLRSKLRSLKKAGDVKFGRTRRTKQRVRDAMRILDWKSDQLDNYGSRNPFNVNSQPSPLRITIENALNNNDQSLQVFGLYLNGEMIAGMLAFVSNETFYYFVTAFSDDVGKKYSAGTLLLVKTLELASRSGLKSYDFLIGDETYKSDWCDTRIPLVHYTRAFSMQGLLICLLIRVRLVIKKYLLHFPKLLSSVQHRLNHIHSQKTNTISVLPSATESPKPTTTKNKFKGLA